MIRRLHFCRLHGFIDAFSIACMRVWMHVCFFLLLCWSGAEPHDDPLEPVVDLFRVDTRRKHRSPHRQGELHFLSFV